MAGESGMSSSLGDVIEITSKVLVIGDCGVGKTSFVWRSCGGKFLGNNYKPTIGSQDRVRALMNTYARGASGVVIVCDVTNRETLEGARVWKQLVEEILVARPPTILIANKYDLPEHVHSFTTSELETFITTNNIDCYFQASVKENINLEEAMRALADLVISHGDRTLRNRDGIHGSTLSLNFPTKKNCCAR